MEAFLLPPITAFLVSFISIKIMDPLALGVGLVDLPSKRKHHVGAIPLVGGIGIFVGVLVALVVHVPAPKVPVLYLVSAALLVFIGAIDDRHDLSVRFRLVGQVLIASLMVFAGNICLTSLGDLLGLGSIELGLWAYPFTILAVVAGINAFNFIDGIDGLAGLLSIVAFGSIGMLTFISQSEISQTVFIPILMVSAIVPYLMFNLGLMGGKLKKVFMGDAGSMFLGLSVIWMLIIGTQGETKSFSPVIALWLVAIPLMDMGAIIIRRMKDGQSPSSPDRGHIHHILMRVGYSDRKTLLIIVALSIMFAGSGVVLQMLHMPDYICFMLFLGVFGIYNYILDVFHNEPEFGVTLISKSFLRGENVSQDMGYYSRERKEAKYK